MGVRSLIEKRPNREELNLQRISSVVSINLFSMRQHFPIHQWMSASISERAPRQELHHMNIWRTYKEANAKIRIQKDVIEMGGTILKLESRGLGTSPLV